MNNIQSLLKKILKVILWIAVSLLFLLIIIVLLIQLPSIQNKIIHSATSFVSDKTHTRVEIKKLKISFPKSVVIEDLYLEDLSRDTLVYAGKVKINIALLSLLKHHINVNSFSLEEATISLSTTKTDSLFNYNFLLTAFNDTSTETKTPSESPWKFDLDNAILNDIHLNYNDEYRGILAIADLGNLELKMDELNPGKSLIANNIQLDNSNLSFSDSINKLSVNASVKHFELNGASIDLQNNIATLDELELSKSEIQYYTDKVASNPDSTSSKPMPPEGNNWKADVRSISLNDNTLSYQSGAEPVKRNIFDANYLIFSHLTLQISSLFYSPDSSGLSVKKFNTTDQNNFSITKFEADFSMDQHSVAIRKLKAATVNSSVEAEFDLKCSSLKALKDSIPFAVLNLNMKDVNIKNSDIIYFDQTLAKQPFFKNAENLTSFSGIISGPVNDLKGENIVVKTGESTLLKTDFNISGLPLIENTHFHFPDLIINSGRQDIEMMAGDSIPNNIRIPENLSLNVSFNGKIREFESTLSLDCNYGNVKISAAISKNGYFNTRLNIAGFDFGALLGDTSMFGPVSLTSEANGHGLNIDSVEADISVVLSEAYLNKYVYHNLLMDGKIRGQEFTGKISLNDENAIFDFDGLVNLNPKNKNYAFKLSVKGADLQKLNITHDDIRISLNATADLKTDQSNNMNGKAGIKNIIIKKGEKIYVLDSLLFVSINKENKNELSLTSAIVGIKYSGSVSPANISVELKSFFNNYFPLSEKNELKKNNSPVKFNLEIMLHDHPLLTQLLFPQLKEFETGPIKVSFDSEKNDLKINAILKKLIYGNYEIKDLVVDVTSNSGSLNYKISSAMLSSSQVKLDNFSFDGKLSDQIIYANLSSIADNKDRKIVMSSRITKNNTNYKLVFDPDFILMNTQWSIDLDNYVEFGKEGLLIHNFFIKNKAGQINIASVHDKFNDDLNIGIENFKLDDISHIIEKDTNLIMGTVDGNVLLKKVNNKYGLIADVKISDMEFRSIPVGTLTVKADNSTAGKFDIDVNLSGAGNNMVSKGYFIPEGENNSLNIKTEVQSLSMKTLEAFSMGQIREATGTISGNLLINGSTGKPEITGELLFNDVSVKPSVLNNNLELKHESIRLKNDGIYFDSFTLLDINNHSAVIDGAIHMKEFKDFNFALNISTTDFLLFNSTVSDNKLFYGKMVINSKIDIKGPLALPVIKGSLNIKDESKFTFVVPESRLTTDKGEDVVEFADSRLNPILSGDTGKIEKKSNFTGFDISTIIEIDKLAELRLLMDPSSSDSLVVKGGAQLSLVIDRSGKMSLTGSYNLEEGSYVVSMEFVKRKFDIIPGSSIIWNGDPLDAKISINTKYIVRASPYDLMARQLSGMGDAEQGSYKQPYPFWVLLNLQGDILHPEIKFEIQLPPENKGILGGAVNQKLLMLKEDESELNKQVFALLVLGRFVQENPLQTESGGTSSLVRSTVGNFLSAQLNKFSSQALPGVELSFDVQSYNEYETGQAKGRTQVEVGVKKQLLDERLSVQVGGSVDLEGEKARQNSGSNIAGDVSLEYKLTGDGRLRMKAFRHNQYEGAIEGQLVETGAGIVYVRDFDRWKEIFKPLRRKAIR